MAWKVLPRDVKKYLILSTISGLSFTAIIASSTLGNLLDFPIEKVGWLFSFSFAIQALLTYFLGRRFEKVSPNLGLFWARILFSFGTLIYALCTNVWLFAFAQILVSFVDVFYPSVVMYERAVFVPKYRESTYSLMFFFTESSKAVVYFVFVFILSKYVSGVAFLRIVFLLLFVINVFYAFSFIRILPRVKRGSDLHQDHVYKPTSAKIFLRFMVHQYLAFTSFGFSSFLILSYYLMDYFGLSSNSPFLFEMIFSTTVATSIVWKAKLKLPADVNLSVGLCLLGGSFLIMMYPNVYLFFAAHVVMGIGFILWLPAKETIKTTISPRELGRWEGFFQGLNIFTKVFSPIVSAIMATHIGYKYVFMLSGALLICSWLVAIPAIKWYKQNHIAVTQS